MVHHAFQWIKLQLRNVSFRKLQTFSKPILLVPSKILREILIHYARTSGPPGVER